jgi:Sulfotransferase domain
VSTRPESDAASPPVPRFVIVGAQKSGTRWLRKNLGEHPDVFTSRSEVHFWNREHRVTKLGLDWYREQFNGWSGEPIVGEATPGYMIWRHQPARVAARMKELCPDTRLIAILRNPIDRANSAMVHHIRRGRLPAGSRLVDVARERTPPEKDRFCLVAGGWYAASLEPFLEAFGEGLLVLWHDDIATDPVGVYDAALRHVGASPGFQPLELSKVVFSNRRGKAARLYELTDADRVDMWEYFRDDVARLERLFGVDLSRWEPREESSSRGTAPALADARSRWWGRRRAPT